MKNLLLFGTTNYGPTLNSSDKLKFQELSKNFKTYVITFGNENKYIDHNIVGIKYMKKPKILFFEIGDCLLVKIESINLCISFFLFFLSGYS